MKDDIRKEWSKFSKFISLQAQYWSRVGKLFLGWTDEIKKILARLMYRQRGRFSQSFVNVSMASLFFLAIVLSGKVEELMSGNRNKEGGSGYLLWPKMEIRRQEH
jgi:hypothetical protein